MSLSRRTKLWLAVLALSLAAAGILVFLKPLPFEPGEVVVAVDFSRPPSASPGLGVGPDEDRKLLRLSAEASNDPFSPLKAPAPASLGTPAVAVKAPAKPKPALQAGGDSAPAPAVAPPVPFRAIGSIQGEDVMQGARVAFVQHQDQLQLVRAGDLLAQSWRVEAVTASHLQLIYLPLMQRQSLALGP